MNFLIFAHSESYTGANIVLLKNIELLRTRHNLFVVCPELGVLPRELQKLNIPCFIIPQRWWCYNKIDMKSFVAFLYYNVVALVKIIRLLREFNVELAYTNTLTIPIGAIAAKLLGIRHFWHIHEFGKEDHGFKFYFGEKRTFQLISLFSDRILTVSNALKNKFISLGIETSKLSVVYNIPMNISEKNEPRTRPMSNPLQIICVGRYSPLKNFEDAINACQFLKEKIDFHLSIYGGINNKKYYQELMTLINDLNLHGFVTLHGAKSNIEEYYSNADLMIVTSKKEAFGLVTIEAMSYGLPVLGSNSGANPELIPEHDLLLYKLHDSFDLAGKIIKIASSPELYSDVCKAIFNKKNEIINCAHENSIFNITF